MDRGPSRKIDAPRNMFVGAGHEVHSRKVGCGQSQVPQHPRPSTHMRTRTHTRRRAVHMPAPAHRSRHMLARDGAADGVLFRFEMSAEGAQWLPLAV